MSVKISNNLPAIDLLKRENIFVMTEDRADEQNIRPLKILILNLMPTKSVTETQLLRKLSNSPLQVEVEFIHVASHTAKNTDSKYLDSFYTTYEQVREHRFDGMIITGAPVELMPFEEVDYWPELSEIMRWTTTNVHSTLHICWGAQAGLYYHYGIKKHTLSKKIFGVFDHSVMEYHSPFLFGFDDTFKMPHSRYTTVFKDDILAVPELELLAVSDEAGVAIVKSSDSRQIFVTGHAEYDADTLALEYFRDRDSGLDTAIPKNYFPDGDSSRPPVISWRAHAQLLFNNWLNYCVYQSTPFDIDEIGKK
ncbi:MAG: homoserine O-succinyltransferase [Oscillospiraceae bacterium]|jgi:homoserine O-succinyltransferase|nr:homoserine O-succinyltransferase [Oscillospiraceae bacterium]